MSFLMVLSAFIPVSSFFLIECCDKNVCLLIYKLSKFYDVIVFNFMCMFYDKFVILHKFVEEKALLKLCNMVCHIRQ